MNKDYNVLLNVNDLLASDDTSVACCMRDAAEILTLFAAVEAELGHINGLAESELASEREQSDALLNSWAVDVSFGRYKATVQLSCMDTYAAFVSFVVVAMQNICFNI